MVGGLLVFKADALVWFKGYEQLAVVEGEVGTGGVVEDVLA